MNRATTLLIPLPERIPEEQEMRKNEKSELQLSVAASTSNVSLSVQTLQTPEVVNPLTHKSYHEMSDRPVHESDVLNQMHANLAQLADLQARLNFVMREVRYLLKA